LSKNLIAFEKFKVSMKITGTGQIQYSFLPTWKNYCSIW